MTCPIKRRCLANPDMFLRFLTFNPKNTRWIVQINVDRNPRIGKFERRGCSKEMHGLERENFYRQRSYAATAIFPAE
jgi:hypothetical protein